MTIPKQYLKSVSRFLLSFALAYPVAGVVMVLVRFLSYLFLPHIPHGFLLAFFVEALWFGILTPAFLGFPISDEAGVNHVNMYPYIIPTWAFVIFFLASKGWRWVQPTIAGRCNIDVAFSCRPRSRRQRHSTP